MDNHVIEYQFGIEHRTDRVEKTVKAELKKKGFDVDVVNHTLYIDTGDKEKPSEQALIDTGILIGDIITTEIISGTGEHL